MRKKIWTFAIAVSLVVVGLYSQNILAKSSPDPEKDASANDTLALIISDPQNIRTGLDSLLENFKSDPSFPYRTHENNTYKIGESLKYSIKYGPIKAVNTEIAVRGDTTIRNRECYHIVYNARTVPFFDNFFKVDDTYETFIDKEGQFPLRFTRRVHEGNYKRNNVLEFFHDQGKVWSQYRKQTYDINPYTHDILSAYFYIRTLNLQKYKKGDIISLENFSDRKNYNLDIKIHKRDLIETDLGVFRTVVIEPLVLGAGLFKSEGNILIWMTDDKNNIPLRIAIKVAVGSLKAEISEIKGNRHELSSKLNF
jgi:hypothetical protein